MCRHHSLTLCDVCAGLLGLFGAFDENLDSHIDFKEMACGISACCRGPMVEKHKCKCLVVSASHWWYCVWVSTLTVAVCSYSLTLALWWRDFQVIDYQLTWCIWSVLPSMTSVVRHLSVEMLTLCCSLFQSVWPWSWRRPVCRWTPTHVVCDAASSSSTSLSSHALAGQSACMLVVSLIQSILLVTLYQLLTPLYSSLGG